MTLIETVIQLKNLDDDLVICARRPWTSASEVRLVKLDEEHRRPTEIIQKGFDYFIEIFVANEVLEVFGDRPVTDEQKIELLIHYASYDAYPDWVYA